jgi:hypothetical protein
MSRKELLLNMLIGGTGAAGQSLLLAHSLDSYPFTIFIAPPAWFFSLVGWIMAILAPLFSLVLLTVFRSTRRPFVTAIPVVACPLLFWLGYKTPLMVSGYQYADPAARKSDLIATTSVETAFTQFALLLTLEGFVAGVGCGLLVMLFFRRRQIKKYLGC